MPDLSEFNRYKRADPPNVDCFELRNLEDHLWHLAEICVDLHLTQMGSGQLEQPDEWARVAQWLRGAAGLRCVDIDIAYGEPYLPMCSTAEEFHEAASRTASAFATEQTRHLYAWNAVERLLNVLRLPSVPQAAGRFNSATMALRSHWDHREPPEHFTCVANHLRRHVFVDETYATEVRAQKAFELRDWRGESGVLLAAANELRHLPAHDAVDIPAAETWGPETPVISKRIEKLLHPPRLATRGLALSIQMLLTACVLKASLGGVRTPLDGWPARSPDGTWTRATDPSWQLLIDQAHMRPVLLELEE